MSAHEGDCNGTFCDYCGCCEHGEAPGGCVASDAPDGMSCPGYYCCCEGQMGYSKPQRPPEKAEEQDESKPVQLHQELSLFDAQPT